ncbi:MAG: DUF4870 domain-containing protein [Alphaproteobacteria bacterium]|nr:DUF4870 domain-containing protein [Alphaproteobacteria bacterium]
MDTPQPPQVPLDGPPALRFGDPPNSEDRLWGMLAHLANLVLPAIGPFIIYLIYKDKSKFIAYHAIQSAVFHGLLQYVISGAVIGVTCGLGFPILFVSPIVAILWGIKANNGQWEGYPVITSVGR